MLNCWSLSRLVAVQTLLCISLAQDQRSLKLPSAPNYSNNLINSASVSPNPNSTVWLDIDFSNPEAVSITDHLLKALVAPPTTITTNPPYGLNVTGSPYLGKWSLLRIVIEKLPNIQTIHWESQHPIPFSILNTLKTRHPSCRLYYIIPFNFQEDPYDPAYNIDPDWDSYDGVDPGYWNRKALLEKRQTELLPSVVNFKNLYALKADIEYKVDDNFASLELVMKILTSSPSLRELDIHLHSVGCLLGSVPWAFDFLSNPSVRFPPLEILRIRGYDFDESSDGGDVWLFKNHELSSHDYPLPKRKASDGRSNLDVWLEVMDWSQLHTLDIVPTIHMLEKLRGRVLPSLRHLMLRYSDWTDGSNKKSDTDRGISSFVREAALPLRTLGLWNIKPESWNSFLGLNEWHEKLWQELESLTVGNDENSNFVEVDAFTAFIASSPELRRLDMSMERSKLSIHDPYYKAITSSSSLEYLTLRFPTPDNMFLDRGIYDNETLMQTYTETKQNYKLLGEEGDEIDSAINSENLLVLFHGLRQQKVGRELGSLDVYVGNWVERNSCDFTVLSPMLRVARYRCWIEEEEERCQGRQTRNRGYL